MIMTFPNRTDTLPLPITSNAHQQARQLAQLNSLQHNSQVYCNHLAILAVNDYLQMMGIATNLEASECWNPVLCLGADLSDLYVSGLGSLECRAIAPGEKSCLIPPDVWEDRIGYVVVEIDSQQRQATLLGFAKTAAERFSIDQLQPIEELLLHLHQLSVPQSSTRVTLSQWLEQMFEGGWQSLEALMSLQPTNLVPSFRSLPLRDAQAIVQGAKLIDLGINFGQETIVVLVALTPEVDQQLGIVVQVHPAPGDTYLPADLELAVLSETGEILKQVRSRHLDNYIQLPFFQGHRGEQFQLSICHNQVRWTEAFSI